MNFTNVKDYILKSAEIKSEIASDLNIISEIENAALIVQNCYKNDKKVLIAGNGGSAGDAQHMATELVSKFLKNRAGLSAFALTTDSSVLTSVSNDYGYKYVFSRQIEANGKKGDVFIAITTSGMSENIIEAIKMAKEKGLYTVCMTGKALSPVDKICDSVIKIPSTYTPIVQEAQMTVCHIICALVEEEIFKEIPC